MKKSVLIGGLAALVFLGFQVNQENGDLKQTKVEEKAARSVAKKKKKKARQDYFFNLLRDPATNSIPNRIRARELNFAKSLFKSNTKTNLHSAQSGLLADIEWKEAGPNNIGGRTRAIAVDRQNSDLVIAGGASGGIWKSADRGESWSLKNTPDQQLSVSFVSQDPRDGKGNIWYYSSGEQDGSAGDSGGTSTFLGSGIYRSSDFGETWSLLQTAGNPTLKDTPYDNVSKIRVHPTSGSIFIASNSNGILRSDDDGGSFTLILGQNGPIWSDFDISPDGSMLAVVDSDPLGGSAGSGLFRSTDDGISWTNITPANFPVSRQRTAIAIAPSNPEIAYALINGIDDKASFLKLNLAAGTAEDRTINLPPTTFGFDEGVNFQGGFNMTLIVKPDNENFVLLGATNIYRSRDGFASPATDEDENWIGGYGNGTEGVDCPACYSGHHPDQHGMLFDPNDPNKFWSSHDGGLSYSTDISRSPHLWDNKNNGYNVTQFYHASMPRAAGDQRLIGGTQDNGSPAFRFDGTNTGHGIDVTSGDGAYSYMGENFAIGSTQGAALVKLGYDSQGDPKIFEEDLAIQGIQNPIFIHPFVVDPNEENSIYVPDGESLWKSDLANLTWSLLSEVEATGSTAITAVAISEDNPRHRLYFGGSNKIFRIDGIDSNTDGEVDISPSGASFDGYLNDIAVNASNGDELIAVYSNYNVDGLFHSNDAGQSWSGIEGNLRGTTENPGPSIRSASIVDLGGQKIYLLATSIGVYSSSELSGENTQWTQVGRDTIGNVVAVWIRTRTSDGQVLVATHGRGIFIGTPMRSVSKENHEIVESKILKLFGNYPNPFRDRTTLLFSSSRAGTVVLSLFDIQGRQVLKQEKSIFSSGEQTIEIEANHLPPGTYLFELNMGSSRSTGNFKVIR